MRRTLGAVLLAIGLGAAPAAAQTYPSKPVKVVVRYTPGSPVDGLARAVTQHAAARLGQSFIIDNRPGAGTTIGTKVAARADEPSSGRVSPARSRASSDALCARTF